MDAACERQEIGTMETIYRSLYDLPVYLAVIVALGIHDPEIPWRLGEGKS